MHTPSRRQMCMTRRRLANNLALNGDVNNATHRHHHARRADHHKSTICAHMPPNMRQIEDKALKTSHLDMTMPHMIAGLRMAPAACVGRKPTTPRSACPVTNGLERDYFPSTNFIMSGRETTFQQTNMGTIAHNHPPRSGRARYERGRPAPEGAVRPINMVSGRKCRHPGIFAASCFSTMRSPARPAALYLAAGSPNGLDRPHC